MARKPNGPKNIHVSTLEADLEIQARSTGDVPADGRYHTVFTVGALADDWEAPEHAAMHAANCLAVVQDALTRGLHPTGEAQYDGATPDDRTHRPASKRTTALAYSVPVVPAHAATAADTVTPAKILKANGK